MPNYMYHNLPYHMKQPLSSYIKSCHTYILWQQKICACETQLFHGGRISLRVRGYTQVIKPRIYFCFISKHVLLGVNFILIIDPLGYKTRNEFYNTSYGMKIHLRSYIYASVFSMWIKRQGYLELIKTLSRICITVWSIHSIIGHLVYMYPIQSLD